MSDVMHLWLNSEIAEYLEGGATALADSAVKWVRGTYGNSHDMTACAYGACNYAQTKAMATVGVLASPYRYELKPYLQKRYGVDSLIRYNDAAKNVDEVIDTLRHLAKEFRNA